MKFLLRSVGILGVVWSLFFVFIVDSVFALQSFDFINALSDRILNDCGYSRIYAQGELIVNTDSGVILNLKNKEDLVGFITNISHLPFKSYIEMNGSRTYDPLIQPAIKRVFPDGREVELDNTGDNIIFCGEMALDINGDKFIWNENLYETPRRVVKRSVFENFTLLVVSIISRGGFTLLGFGLFSVLGVSIFEIIRRGVRKKQKNKSRS